MSLYHFRKFKIKNIFLFLTAAAFVLMIMSCKKKDAENQTTAENNEVVKVNDSENSFYSPSEDDASWVDSLLMRIEEERIAEELAKMEESRSEYLMNEEDESAELTESAPDSEEKTESESEPEEEKNPIELFFESTDEGRVLSGKNNELRFYEFQNEILSPQTTNEGYIIVHSADGRVMRNFYNFEYQLVKKEEWNIRSASDAKKEKTEEYNYSDESGKIAQKEILTADAAETVTYNEAAYPLTSKKYILKDSKKYISMERSWSYDEDNRVVKDEQKEYSYKEQNYKKQPTLFTRRYEYTYNDNLQEESEDKDEIPPDLKYFENNVLKMHNKYSREKGNYISWIYFDDILSVKTYYEDEVRVRDEYYNNGKLFRAKDYEKPETENGETQSVVHQGEEE